MVMFSDAQPMAGGRHRIASGQLDEPPRGMPLTPAQFKQHRRLAERRNVPLRVVLDAVAGRSAQRRPR